MSPRDHYVAEQAPDWRNTRPADLPPRVSTPDRPAASIEAWRTSPGVRREYERGLRNGWIGAMAFYAIASAALILVFCVLGFRP